MSKQLDHIYIKTVELFDKLVLDEKFLNVPSADKFRIASEMVRNEIEQKRNEIEEKRNTILDQSYDSLSEEIRDSAKRMYDALTRR